jgi:hypothetical protein
MDHVVYVDAVAKELEKLQEGTKTMILRGAAGRKLPYGRVNLGDTLYFIRNNGEGTVQAKAQVKSVINSDKLSPDESNQLMDDHRDCLQFTNKQKERWGGKRYLVLVEVEGVTVVEPFAIDRSQYFNMDDWLPVDRIESVRTN